MTDFPMIAFPPETDERKAARLEGEIAACLRNHALLRKGAPVVVRNNGILRSGIRELLDDLPPDDDLGPLREKLEAALTIPFVYQREQPADLVVSDDQPPEPIAERIGFLKARLRSYGRTNYLIQEAGAPVVWNSDAMRDVMRELIRELEPAPDPDGTDNPATLDDALVAAIVDKLRAVLKAASD